MKEREMFETVKELGTVLAEEIKSLKERMDKLENRDSVVCKPDEGNSKLKIVEMDIDWPEKDIAGIHFDALSTHAVFELKDDGNYYSRDILFNSARDTDEETGRDLLSEYLDSEEVRQTFITAFYEAIDELEESGVEMRVFIPEENQGVKKYNGVKWWYWLKPRSASSSAYFCNVHSNGYSTSNDASAVGGVAPAFCVA